MNLSKSKYCNAVQCNKMLWLLKNHPDMQDESANQAVLDNGTDVGELAKDLFGNHINITFNENLNQMINDTNDALLQDNVIITEASFVYDNNFCSVDILKKVNDTYEVFEVKSSTEIKDIYLDDVSYQVYVLKSLGLNVVSSSIVYINSEYTRHGDLDLKKLFKIENVTNIVLEKQDEIKNKIKEINKYMEQKDEPTMQLGVHCMKPYECPYFKYCTKDLPKNNIFDVRSMQTTKKFDLYNKGYVSFEDLLKTDINEKFIQQIDFEINNKEPYIDTLEIKKFMNNLHYPLYFLDFETFQQTIPLFDDVKPYMQIPFQYSLHYIETEGGKLEHKEFLADALVDPRRTLALRLVEDIPKDGCVIAYNMMFEKMVIRNLAYLFPDLSDHLLAIHDNIQDLMIPFKNRGYYTKEMKGSYSIKYVLPALFPDDESLNYHNLDLIHNGSEAMNSYASLGDLPSDEQEIIRKNLLKYCELDTYAMVKIWERLNEVLENEKVVI